MVLAVVVRFGVVIDFRVVGFSVVVSIVVVFLAVVITGLGIVVVSAVVGFGVVVFAVSYKAWYFFMVNERIFNGKQLTLFVLPFSIGVNS